MVSVNQVKRPQGMPRRRCEYNSKRDLKLMSVRTRSWIDSAQDRDYWKALVNAALNSGFIEHKIC